MTGPSINFVPKPSEMKIPAWSFTRQNALRALIVIAMLSLVATLYLVQASIITSTTMEIETLQTQINLLDQKNGDLALEIAQMESLGNIQTRATALGLVPTRPEDIDYLYIESQQTTPPTDGDANTVR